MLLQPLNVLAFIGKNRMMGFAKYVIRKLEIHCWFSEGMPILILMKAGRPGKGSNHFSYTLRFMPTDRTAYCDILFDI